MGSKAVRVVCMVPEKLSSNRLLSESEHSMKASDLVSGPHETTTCARLFSDGVNFAFIPLSSEIPDILNGKHLKTFR